MLGTAKKAEALAVNVDIKARTRLLACFASDVQEENIQQHTILH